jgi:hypothetical protein
VATRTTHFGVGSSMGTSEYTSMSGSCSAASHSDLARSLRSSVAGDAIERGMQLSMCCDKGNGANPGASQSPPRRGA